MNRLDELRAALRDATEAADAEWRSDSPRLAVCQELSREEQRLRVEIVREGGCCGWLREHDTGPRCGCAAVRLDVAERLNVDEHVPWLDACQWSDYCSQSEAFRLARQMRCFDELQGICIQNLVRIAHESIEGSKDGTGSKAGGDSAANS